MTGRLLLAVDAGNTNTVFGVYDGDVQGGQWRASTNASRTADEYAVWLGNLLVRDGIAASDLDAAIICSVVPECNFHLKTLCETCYGFTPIMVDADKDLGIGIAVDNPREVGADRLANAVGAHGRYDGALILIDFGTATTFDVVGADGTYRGGVIAPGIDLSLEALHTAAAQLPRVAPARPQAVIGTSTITMMQSGVYWGYISLIEGVVSRIKTEFDAPMTIVATGGLSPLFHAATTVIEHIDPDLTMRGLVEIFRRNSETT